MDKENSRPVRPRPGLFAASGFYLLAALGLWAVSAISPYVPGASHEWRALVVSVLYYGLFLIAPVTLWGLHKKCPADALRLNPVGLGSVLTAVFTALMCVLICNNFNVVWSVLWQKLGLNVFVDSYVRPANRTELTVSVLNASLLTVVGEELVFRGVMFSAWERRGSKRAVWVTAVLFAMLHGSLLGLPAQLLCGIVLALIVLCTDSLYSGMIFHAVYNAAMVMLNYASTAPSVMETAASQQELMQTDIIAALGGGGVLFGIVLETGFYLLLLMVSLRGLRRRARWWGIEIQPEAPVPMLRREMAALLVAAASAALMYAMDLMRMLGG